jgi:GDP-L-fucose synthase
MELNSKVYIAGHKGMVGSAIWRNLEAKGYTHLIGKSSKELNLLNQQAVKDFFEQEKPEYVFLAAAKVGGIVANNTYRAQFIYENLQIQNNVIHQAYLSGVEKLMFLGSSCIYPKFAPQPMKEEHLLTGLLEETNEPYAIAKIAGIKMCQAYHDQYGCNFISVMPTNLYGPNDNFNLETSHVLPAMIRKMHLAKSLENGDFDAIRDDLDKRTKEQRNERMNERLSEGEIISYLENNGIALSSNRPISHSLNRSVVLNLWGTGSPKREFLYVEDMAEACVYLMLNYNQKQFLNIGCGEDISIKDLALLVREIVGFKGELKFDTSKPDGTPRKLLDVSKLYATGWRPKIGLEEGIKKLYLKIS